jgi:hypothetical protein
LGRPTRPQERDEDEEVVLPEEEEEEEAVENDEEDQLEDLARQVTDHSLGLQLLVAALLTVVAITQI